MADTGLSNRSIARIACWNYCKTNSGYYWRLKYQIFTDHFVTWRRLVDREEWIQSVTTARRSLLTTDYIIGLPVHTDNKQTHGQMVDTTCGSIRFRVCLNTLNWRFKSFYRPIQQLPTPNVLTDRFAIVWLYRVTVMFYIQCQTASACLLTTATKHLDHLATDSAAPTFWLSLLKDFIVICEFQNRVHNNISYIIDINQQQ